MIITYYGQAFVKAQVGETIFAFNPVSRDFDEKAAKFGADVALISQRLPAMNGVASVSFGSREPFVIDGPGEYELAGTFIRGFSSVGPGGRINTIYTTTLDGINLCHLGGLAGAAVLPEVIEELGTVDILFLPVGGTALPPKEAAKLATALEAKVIIPLPADPASLKTVLKELGAEEVQAVEKLTLKRKDVEGKEGEVIVLAAA